MQGLTLYLNEISAARKYATDEQFGRLCKLALDLTENGSEEMPTFENKEDAIFFEGFLHCLNTSRTKSKNGKKGGAPLGNRNAVKPNTDFDVSCYSADTKSKIERRSLEEPNENDIQLLVGALEQYKPSKNQSAKTMKMNNGRTIGAFIDGHKISDSTLEAAWKIYTNNNN